MDEETAKKIALLRTLSHYKPEQFITFMYLFGGCKFLEEQRKETKI